ncbi:MAG: BON domain-containing protein [Armatimonadota bacterium]
MQGTDSELKQRIEQLLEGTSRVDHREVEVSVRDSVVTLRGQVDSAIEKRYAREVAEETPGVRRVVDEMTVKNFVKRSNAELAEAVRHALARDAYAQNGKIEVYANHGEIRLDGSVPDYHTRKAAGDVAWWTPGVINVENLLLVTEEEFVDVSPLEVPNA